MKIRLEELGKVHYMNVSALGERSLLLQPFFDGQAWHLWGPDPEGALIEIAIVDFTLGQYFAKEPASPDKDVLFQFFEFITKHALFPEVVSFANGIENDVHNLGATLWKLDTWFDLQDQARQGSERLALTEFEYVLVVCRSLLDLLQAIIARLWERVELSDSKMKKNSLPRRSFSDVVLGKNDEPQSPEAVAARYGLPEPFAQFYSQQATFFLRLRSVRDAIVHRGTRSFPILRTERGFAIASGQQPFSDIVAWDETQLAPNKLGSLRFLIAYLIRETLRVCEEFALVMAQTLRLPADIAPGYHVFIRGYHTHPLRRLELICANPWERFVPDTAASAPQDYRGQPG